jgi:hypothetical protein
MRQKPDQSGASAETLLFLTASNAARKPARTLQQGLDTGHRQAAPVAARWRE